MFKEVNTYASHYTDLDCVISGEPLLLKNSGVLLLFCKDGVCVPTTNMDTQGNKTCLCSGVQVTQHEESRIQSQTLTDV